MQVFITTIETLRNHQIQKNRFKGDVLGIVSDVFILRNYFAVCKIGDVSFQRCYFDFQQPYGRSQEPKDSNIEPVTVKESKGSVIYNLLSMTSLQCAFVH